jgi:hypothetical protein
MKLAKILIILVLVAICLPPVASAVPGSDIVITADGGTRLHLEKAGRGPASYSCQCDGTGWMTIYRRAENAGGYPRGAVRASETRVYRLTAGSFWIPRAANYDSTSVTWESGSELIIRPED